jgi:hypothetical protein
MDRYIKVIGKMENKMDKGFISIRKVMKLKLNGWMEKKFKFIEKIRKYKNSYNKKTHHPS